MSGLTSGTLLGRVHDFLKIYLPSHRHVSPNTVRAYTKAIDQFLDFVKLQKHVSLGDVTFEMLTADTILTFLDHLEADNGCSTSTRNQRLAAIRSFIKYAATRDITVAANVKELKAVPTKKPDATVLIDYMSEAAVSAILAEPDPVTPKGLRDRCLLMLMYDTGARVQEVVTLKLRDFRWGRKPTVTLHGKGGKDRTVPLAEKTTAHLKLYLDAFHPSPRDNEQFLFYTVIHYTVQPLTDRRIRYIVKEYGVAARKKCKEVPENVFPHLWRHSRAMHLYQHGMDLTLISQWLGHAQLETTQIYAHADTEHKRVAIEKATSSASPLNGKISSPRFIVTDDDTLRRLAGLI
jgi:site-specific recombinase XerD